MVFSIPQNIFVTSASLNVNTFTYDSLSPTQTLSLFDVTTSLSSLLAGTGGVAAYDDLGSGVLYGSRVYTAADQNQFRTISLDAAAITAIQQAVGSFFAVGGSVDAVAGVPEPSTWSMLAFGMGLVSWRLRSRAKGVRGDDLKSPNSR